MRHLQCILKPHNGKQRDLMLGQLALQNLKAAIHYCLRNHTHLGFQIICFFEAQLTCKELNVYGIALVGSPSIAMGFNENLGWALTFNQADTMDLIELEIVDNKYLVDGNWKPLQSTKKNNQSKKRRTVSYQKRFKLRKSDFGFIVEEKNGKSTRLKIIWIRSSIFYAAV